MKRIKYSVGILLILAGFLFTGELSIYYLDNFQESYYRAGFAFVDLLPGTTDEDIVKDFLQAGEKHNVDFFVVDSKILSDFRKKITVYGTEGALKYLQEKEFEEKKYASLLTGETQLNYKNYANLHNVESIENYYFIGDKSQLENMREFKRDLIDKYGGGFPNLYGSSNSMFFNLFFVWGSIFILICLLSWYDIFCQKKEIMIKLTLGEDVKYIFLKNILLDNCAFIIAYVCIPQFLYRVSNITFKVTYVSVAFVLFLLINIGINSMVFRMNIKKDFANSKGSNKVLITNYILKSISSITVILLLCANIVILMEGYDYHLQRGFFEKHKDYNYYQLNYKIYNKLEKSDDEEIVVQQIFYQRFQQQSLEYVNMSESMDINYPTILINATTKKEIINNFPELQDQFKNMSDNKIYILIPENSKKAQGKMEELELICQMYFGEKSQLSFEVITYHSVVKLVAMNKMTHTYRSKMLKNPIIILNHTFQEIDSQTARAQTHYAYDVMYKIPKKDVKAFINEFQLKDQIVVETNVLEYYTHNWKIIKRSIKLLAALSLFLLVFEMALIIFIIKMEYSINAIEICLKKVLGYNLFERNKKLITITLISSVVSMLSALYLHFRLGMQEGIYLLFGSILLFVMEMIYIYLKIKAVEKANVVTILKGEGL